VAARSPGDHPLPAQADELRFTGAPTTVPVLADPTSEQRQAFDLSTALIPLALRK
jgi:hypothetical protein